VLTGHTTVNDEKLKTLSTRFKQSYINVEYFSEVLQSFLYILRVLGDRKQHAM